MARPRGPDRMTPLYKGMGLWHWAWFALEAITVFALTFALITALSLVLR